MPDIMKLDYTLEDFQLSWGIKSSGDRENFRIP